MNHNIQAFHGPRDKYRNPAGYDTITARATKVKYRAYWTYYQVYYAMLYLLQNDITLFGYETLDTNKTPSNECFQVGQ